MAFTPISNDFIQYQATASGTSAAGYFLRLYAAGTTTPIAVSLDKDGFNLVIKVELDSQGFAKNNSGGSTTLYIDQEYRLVLFVNAADADNSNFANAIQDLDNIPQVLTLEAVNESLNAVKNIATLALAVSDINLVDGDAIKIAERTTGNGGGATWDVVLSSTVTENAFNIVQCTGVPALSLVLSIGEDVFADEFGIPFDGSDSFAAITEALTIGKRVVLNSGRTFTTNTEIVMTDNSHLHLQSGATLTGDTGTVVRITCQYSSLTGEGWSSIIQNTAIDSIHGVVLLGHPNTTDTTLVFYNTLDNFRIVGADNLGTVAASSGKYTVGLMLFNSQAFDVNGAVYYNKITNLFVEQVKEGIILTSTVNANIFNNIIIRLIGQTGFGIFSPFSTSLIGNRYGYDWDTATRDSRAAENVITNIFVTDCLHPYGNLEGGGAVPPVPGYTAISYGDGNTYHDFGATLRLEEFTERQTFVNFSAEPGFGGAYEISADTLNLSVFGTFNIQVRSGSLGTTSGATIFNGSGSSIASSNIQTLNAFNTKIMAVGSDAAPSIHDRFDTSTGLRFPSVQILSLISNGVGQLRVNDTTAGGLSGVEIWDHGGASWERITFGAPDSGGTGARALIVPN